MNRKITSKDFKKICIRGRVAFAICCLENAMEKYGIKGRGWELLLENLWSFTSIPCRYITTADSGTEFILERWFNKVGIRANFIIKTDYDTARQSDYDMIEESSYNLMRRELSNQSNEVLNNINSLILDIGFCELWSGLDNVSKDTLNGLQKLIDYMNSQEIPMPDVQPFKQYEYNPKGIDEDSRGWGYPFDGTRYSKFLNK